MFPCVGGSFFFQRKGLKSVISQCTQKRHPDQLTCEALTRSGGNLSTPRGRRAWENPHLRSSRGREGRVQRHELQHTPTWNSSDATTLRGHVNSGTSRTFAVAKPRRNRAVSSEKLPPTSPASTTRRALPRSPTNSGKRVSFRRLATWRHTPLTAAVRCFATPSLVKGQTKVVSTASCAPWKRSSPSTTTSSLLVSNWSTAPRSKSRTKMLVRTLPPASRQILAAAFSRLNPLRPNVPTTAHTDL